MMITMMKMVIKYWMLICFLISKFLSLNRQLIVVRCFELWLVLYIVQFIKRFYFYFGNIGKHSTSTIINCYYTTTTIYYFYLLWCFINQLHSNSKLQPRMVCSYNIASQTFTSTSTHNFGIWFYFSWNLASNEH